MKELLDIGKKATNYAQKLGADEAEIFLYVQNFTSLKFASGIFASRGGAVKGIKGSFVRIAEPWIKKKGLPMITSGVKAGIGIRAIINKAIGFASISNIEEKKVLETVEEAVKIAKIRPPDSNWVSLPEAKQPTGQGGIFDKRIPELSAEELLDQCVDGCLVVADYDKRITQAMATLSTAHGSFAVVNTSNVEVFDSVTTFEAFFGAKAKSGDEEVSSGDFIASRSFVRNLHPIASSASKRAIECLSRKPLPEKYVGPVVFENISWNQLFSLVFISSTSALNIQENRSAFKGKLGKQVAKDNVSVVDDGTLPDGFGTSKIDDEGVPRQKTPLIEKGVLSNILYDNYTAKREGRESTGNASRQGHASPNYANQPTIRPSNLTLMPGKGNFEDLISEMKDGILVKGFLIGAIFSNAVTGDFSVTAENAFKIEHGEIAYPLKPCTVAGNLFDALNSLVTIGSDLKGFMMLPNITCPSVTTEKIVVST
jgi:PmbA protein